MLLQSQSPAGGSWNLLTQTIPTNNINEATKNGQTQIAVSYTPTKNFIDFIICICKEENGNQKNATRYSYSHAQHPIWSKLSV